MTVKIIYPILSCKYFLRIPTKTTFIFAKSWKLYQLIIGHVDFLFSFDTYDVVRSWSIFLLPSIVLDNLFGWGDLYTIHINFENLTNVPKHLVSSVLFPLIRNSNKWMCVLYCVTPQLSIHTFRAYTPYPKRVQTRFEPLDPIYTRASGRAIENRIYREELKESLV